MIPPRRQVTHRRFAPAAFAGLLCFFLLACSLSGVANDLEQTLAPEDPDATVESSDRIPPEPETDPDGWPLILRESFDDNANRWFTGKYEGDLILETVAIRDGKYRWETTAKDSVTDYGFPDLGEFGDVRLAVEGRQTGGSSEAEYGIIFRSTEDSDYTFGVCEGTGEFFLGRYADDEYVEIIEYTESGAIRPGEANLLAVRARGSRFELSINGESVGEAEDFRIPFGEVGVFIYLNHPGDSAEFEFDNFEVYSPADNADSSTI